MPHDLATDAVERILVQFPTLFASHSARILRLLEQECENASLERLLETVIRTLGDLLGTAAMHGTALVM